ncbi:hypothetical protein DFH07DRAFT_767310 [Mycena maculata]|uniref:Uncharacterized protein n=1 Tax=Mycena maculata TaxID=230809 RepID=A0AAD7JYQ2_9AGAR|nr:hypothetical protein DFH07DRAFT_767310 [Mycena maculata]
MTSQPDTSPSMILTMHKGPTPEETLIAYEVDTTSIVYGLPPSSYKEELLRDYRGTFHAAAHNERCQVTYDISCQYLKNLHEVQQTGSHTDSDSDSLISSDSSPPPLEDVAPSPVLSSPAPITSPVGERPWGASGWHEAFVHVPDDFVPARLAMIDGEPLERAWASLGAQNPRAALATYNRVQQTGAGAWEDPFDSPVSSHPDEPKNIDEEMDMKTGHHNLRTQIISIHGIKNVQCSCDDSKHSQHTRRDAFTFTDAAGHVVIKKLKTLSLPLN